MSSEDVRRHRFEHASRSARSQAFRRTGRYTIFGVLALLGVAAVAGAVIGLRGIMDQGSSSSSGEPWTPSPAPDFALPSTTGGTISLSDYEGRTAVLLYFFEGIMCAPCWDQVGDIQEQSAEFQAMDMEVLSITVDPMNALVKESQRRGLTVPILDDKDLSVSTAYGMLNNSMHPGSRPGHSFALIDRDGDLVWTKHYYFVDHVMNMVGMEGMAMATKDSRMYVPMDELLRDIRSASTVLSGTPVPPGMPSGSPVDHSMCITPIHKHVNFKLYLNDRIFNLSQRQYMDQHMDAHFHPTVKVKPGDTPGIPFADVVHVHKDNLTLRFFLTTLDFDDNTRALLDDAQNLHVYANGTLQPAGVDYAPNDWESVLVTHGNLSGEQINRQLGSVTAYLPEDKQRHPELFGGC